VQAQVAASHDCVNDSSDLGYNTSAGTSKLVSQQSVSRSFSPPDAAFTTAAKTATPQVQQPAY
jgi:hypothetical protein